MKVILWAMFFPQGASPARQSAMRESNCVKEPSPSVTPCRDVGKPRLCFCVPGILSGEAKRGLNLPPIALL